MSILKVARMGHPVLRDRAQAIDKSALRNPLVQKLIDDMIDTMHEYSGVGLAAPQVHEGVRIFVALLDEQPESEGDASVLVNPEIAPNAEVKEEGWEGCLSIPDIRGMVPRYTDITVKALDRHGKPIERDPPPPTPYRPPPHGLRRARCPARNRSPGRRAVLRSDDVDAVAHIPRRVFALSRERRGASVIVDLGSGISDSLSIQRVEIGEVSLNRRC
jgi:peptide deformylase